MKHWKGAIEGNIRRGQKMRALEGDKRWEH